VKNLNIKKKRGKVMLNRKKLLMLSVFLLTSLLFSIFTTAATAIEDSKKVKDEVFRLHIKANSDSNEDQALKLKVRDRILAETKTIFANAKSADHAMALAKENIHLLMAIAKDEIAKNGYPYNATASVGTAFFPTKEYEGNIVLAAGDYNALNIFIGEGKGKNWWCMLYPSVCVPSSIKKAKMSDVLNGNALELTRPAKTEKAKLRFKSVEVINNLFGKLKKH
jgi:stage II sporulation protein R